jgi:hypothetical protein
MAASATNRHSLIAAEAGLLRAILSPVAAGKTV